MAGPYISKITLPSGSTYDIKDVEAREGLSALSSMVEGGVHYIGKTTTALSDGSTTNPVVIVGKGEVTAVQGDMASMAKAGSQDLEFIFNGTTWYEIGSTGTLKAFAFVDKGEFSTSYTPQGTFSANLAGGTASVSGSVTANGSVSLTDTEKTVSTSYTPAGTINGAEFTGAEMTSQGTFTPQGTVSAATSETLTATISVGQGTANYKPAGTISQPEFMGDQMTSTGSFTPAGSVSLTNSNVTTTVAAAASGEATYTPAGNVDAPTITVATAGATGTIHNPTAEQVVKTVATAAASSTQVAGELVYCSVAEETLTLSKFTASTGASITTDDVQVKTGDAEYSASAPAFTGTGVRLETGNISVPSSASFSGTAGNVEVIGTPEGTVEQPTFDGTAVNLVNSGITVPKTYSFTGTQGDVSVTGTTTGSVSQGTFTGTAAMISGKVDVPTSASFTGTAVQVSLSGTAAGSVSGDIVGTQATITAEVTPKASV